MALEIKKASNIGFCMGVRRAIDILERVAGEQGGIETLGAVVHNQQVLRRLAERGVSVVNSVDAIQGSLVVISAHGVSPQVIEEIRARRIEVIDTTCPFVRRAQVAARKLAESGFYTIVFGDASHPEVKGILGWANGKGTAIQDSQSLVRLDNLPRRLGVLSQTTQIPAFFARFARELIDRALVKDSELHIIDTICHDIRQRQNDTLKLAEKVDVILVVGGHNSANTRHLVELCSGVTETYPIETADEIEASWLEGKSSIGVTSGASTDEPTIDEVMAKLEYLAQA